MDYYFELNSFRHLFKIDLHLGLMDKTSREQALQILEVLRKGQPEQFTAFGPYYQAIVDGKLPEYYLTELKRRRYQYSDNLPELDVPIDHPEYSYLKLEAAHNHSSYPLMKCRRNVIVGTSLTLTDLVGQEIVFDSTIQ